MQEQKKTFTKAEVEVIRFEKTDVIATSGEDNTNTQTITVEGPPCAQGFQPGPNIW